MEEKELKTNNVAVDFKFRYLVDYFSIFTIHRL